MNHPESIRELFVLIWGCTFTITIGFVGWYALKRYWDNRVKR